ncbi:MAG TPA: ribosome maturation factor RimP [Desulfosalsimonadaceae bacterium]|nr:ribosome maturation factor RimP [Desulfosalsimonadaceae bacterium]
MAKKRKTGQAGGTPPEDRGKPSEREVLEQVWTFAQPLCAAEGMDLVHVEYQREAGGRILRLYIEKPDGVSLDDCTIVSRQLNDILDIKLETAEAYTLEVSSPGARRPVSRASDFTRFEGYTAKIRVARPIAGQKNFTGVLAGYSDATVWLKTGGKTIGIAHSEIIRARLVNSI